MKDLYRKLAMPVVLILIIPQLINLFCCFMLSGHQLRELPMGVYLGDNTAFTRSIVTAFDQSDTFKIELYSDSPEALEQEIRNSRIVFGLAIPKHFSKDMVLKKSPSILTLIDGSRLSAASFAKVGASDLLLGIKSEAFINALNRDLGMSLDEAKTLSKSIAFETRLLHNPTRNYQSFLLPGFMTALVQVGLALAAAATIWPNDRPENYFAVIKKALSYATFAFASILMILSVQIFGFGVPMRGQFLDVAFLTFIFTLCVSLIALWLSATLTDKVFSCQVAAVYFIPSTILSGYSWPVESMPTLYHYIAPLMPFTYYGDTVRSLLLKGFSYSYTHSVISLIIGALFALFISLPSAIFREKLKHAVLNSALGKRIQQSLEFKEED